jgi:hypothetical protein
MQNAILTDFLSCGVYDLSPNFIYSSAAQCQITFNLSRMAALSQMAATLCRCLMPFLTLCRLAACQFRQEHPQCGVPISAKPSLMSLPVQHLKESRHRFWRFAPRAHT